MRYEFELVWICVDLKSVLIEMVLQTRGILDGLVM